MMPNEKKMDAAKGPSAGNTPKKGVKANLPPKVEHHAPVVVGGFRVDSAEFVKGSTSIKHLPEERLPQIAFLGRSNVGKSSLMNALLGRKNLVKVGRTPGKTRELNFFKVNGRFFLVDLPGVGYAKVGNSKRDEMSTFIREYVEKCKDLKGLVYLVDIRHGGHDIDVLTVESIRATGCPVLIVASKRDKVNQSELAKGLRSIRENFGLDENPLCVSSVKKFGLDSLWKCILEALQGKTDGKEGTT